MQDEARLVCTLPMARQGICVTSTRTRSSLGLIPEALMPGARSGAGAEGGGVCAEAASSNRIVSRANNRRMRHASIFAVALLVGLASSRHFLVAWRIARQPKAARAMHVHP